MGNQESASTEEAPIGLPTTQVTMTREGTALVDPYDKATQIQSNRQTINQLAQLIPENPQNKVNAHMQQILLRPVKTGDNFDIRGPSSAEVDVIGRLANGTYTFSNGCKKMPYMPVAFLRKVSNYNPDLNDADL